MKHFMKREVTMMVIRFSLERENNEAGSCCELNIHFVWDQKQAHKLEYHWDTQVL